MTAVCALILDTPVFSYEFDTKIAASGRTIACTGAGNPIDECG